MNDVIFSATGSVCFRLEEAVQYDGYRYHKGQVIHLNTLIQLMNIYSEVKVSCCCVG